MEKRFAPFTRK